MRIGELARQTGASARSLRHYEWAGLLDSRREGNGYRSFSLEDVERVGNIRALLDAGLDLEDARLLYPCLEKQQAGEPLCELAVSRYREKLEEIEERIHALQEVHRRIARRLEEATHRAGEGRGG